MALFGSSQLSGLAVHGASSRTREGQLEVLPIVPWVVYLTLMVPK